MVEEISYGDYSQAYRAIHSALSGLTVPPHGKKITKVGFTWNTDGAVASIKYYDGNELLFTLTFEWSSDRLSNISRT